MEAGTSLLIIHYQLYNQHSPTKKDKIQLDSIKKYIIHG